MAEIFENLKDAVAGVFAKHGDSVLGVDVSSSTIKVVQARRKSGQALLETYGELALGPYAGVDAGRATNLDADTMAAALRDLMRESKVTTKECGVSIPLSASLITVIKMPDVGEKRLKDMVPLEMRKYIPVPVSEVLLDWRVIPTDPTQAESADPRHEVNAPANPAARGEKVDILVVALHRDTIVRYQKLIQAAGLTPTFFEIEAFSTARAVLDGAPPVAMIMDIGAATTKLYILEHRILRESHTINRGSQDISLAIEKALNVSDAKARDLKHTYGLQGGESVQAQQVKDIVALVLDSLLAEAARVMRNYQRVHRANIGAAVLTGGGARLSGLVERAAASFETPVSLADPFAKLAYPAFLEDTLATAGPEFAVAVGAALRKLEEGG